MAYDNAYAKYWSAATVWNKQRARVQQVPVEFPPFPLFLEWVGREFVDGATIRSRYKNAWFAAGLNMERTIELQGVRIDGDPSSSDHTFSTSKNISNQAMEGLDLPLKMVWDVVNNRTGEVASAACTVSTASGEFAHAAHSLKLRRRTRMGTCFSDTWPSDKEVLSALWDMAHGRLDVFHWMQRLTDCLRDAHCDYAGACAALSHVVYRWDQTDIADVVNALLDGTLNGTKHAQVQEDALMATGVFFDRYATYI